VKNEYQGTPPDIHFLFFSIKFLKYFKKQLDKYAAHIV